MSRGLKVLSLFDGISCGMVALERAEIPVERYVAYEIDKYAIQVSQKNYPQIEHMGDVTTADFTQYKGFDLLIGGSPCTYWSIAKKDRETTSDGIGFELFMHFIRAWKESGCKYFLYENNHSIHKDIKSEITKQFGVDFIMINSSLVSAQNRKRCYWTNIPNVTQPNDKGILLKDILIKSVGAEPVGICIDKDGKSQTVKAQYGKTSLANTQYTGSNGATMVAEPIYDSKVVEQKYVEFASKNGYIPTLFNPYNKAEIKLKAPTQTAQCDRINVSSTVLKFEPIRVGQIGKGGQGQRIYSVQGKSVTLSANGGGQGAKTGLYKIDLPDGDYIIRKLTPIEAERLQTLPDNYTEGISNTQRYKCIGNGWTVDVIAHILKGLKEGEKCTK